MANGGVLNGNTRTTVTVVSVALAIGIAFGFFGTHLIPFVTRDELTAQQALFAANMANLQAQIASQLGSITGMQALSNETSVKFGAMDERMKDMDERMKQLTGEVNYLTARDDQRTRR